MGLIRVGPGLDEFFFEIFIDRLVRSGRSGNGQNPILRTLFPFVNIRATHIGEGVGDFLPWIHHDWVHSVHELIKSEFVKESISVSSVSVEDRRFFSLEWFVVYSNWIRILWELRGRSRWWRRRRWPAERFL